MYHTTVVVVPLVLGAHGTVSKDCANWQDYLGPPDEWMRPDDGLLGNGTYSQKGVSRTDHGMNNKQ